MKRALVCLVAACGGGAGKVPAGERIGPALSAALAGATRARVPWRCASPDLPALPDETLGAWRLAGHSLRSDKTSVTIAVVADAGGAASPTIAALGRLRVRLATADLVLALGGMGTTEAELTATLGAIADTAPVVALPGDLESAAALAAAVAKLRAAGKPVVDGRLAQRIELPIATLATLPGAGAASRLVAGPDGCAYRTTDVLAAFADLTARPGLRIVATAEAPRITVDGEAAGFRELTPGPGTEIDLILHGPVSPAASRAVSGTRQAEGIPLSPGTLDATPRLPGPAHSSSAGMLSLRDGAWSWKPITD